MAFLDLVNTVTQKKIIPGITDGVFRNSPLLADMKQNCVEEYDGGPSWQENFLFDVASASAYTPGETFNIDGFNPATGATVYPKWYTVPVGALTEKIRVELAGERAAFDYIGLLMQVAAMTMSAMLTNDLYREGQTAGRSKRINGLDEALSDGSVNGFLAQTYTDYLTVPRASVNGALSSPMTGPAAALGALSYGKLEQAYSSVTIGAESPDLIVTSNLGWSYFKQQFQPQQRFEEVDPDFGFHTFRFNGTRVVADQYCPGTRVANAADTKVGYSTVAAGETMWFLNTKYMRLYVSTDPVYGFGFVDFVPAQNTSWVVGHYRFCGNFTVQAPRLMREFHTITG
jgi:hypothetical protein